MRIYLLIPVIVLAMLAPLRAQVILHTSPPDTAKRDSSKVKVSVLNPNGKTPMRYEGNSMHTDSVQQALKLNPGQFARGEFALYYEYRLSDVFSVEGGLGVTYVDYLYELFVNDGRFLFKSQEGKSVKFQSGFGIHAQLRYFPSRYETAITGFYLAPDFSRRDWRMQYFVNTGLIREPHDTKRSWTDLKLQLGYQDADPYEDFFWEWYIAAGLRIVDQDVIDGDGLDAVFTHEHYVTPVVGMGIKIGFPL
jgi:hypothetical protein